MTAFTVCFHPSYYKPIFDSSEIDCNGIWRTAMFAQAPNQPGSENTSLPETGEAPAPGRPPARPLALAEVPADRPECNPKCSKIDVMYM